MSSVWFGTRAFMQKIRQPLVRPRRARVGWGESSSPYSGRGVLRQSMNAHREYTFVWPHMSREEARKITDYADGVFGPGLIYMSDPYADDQNVLSQAGATPSLAGYDATPLAWVPGPGVTRPVLLPQTDQSQGYPTEKARYTLVAGMTVRPLSVAIPPEHVAWVGVHGDSDAAGKVKVTPFDGATPGTVEYPEILSVSTTERVNTMISGTWLELALDPDEEGACTLAGLIVQILPEGATPEAGGFISGQGHAGLKIDRDSLSETAISLDFVQLSVVLKEVG